MTAAAFITGIGGQDGTYLAERLVADGMEVHALVLEADGHPAHCPEQVVLHAGDLGDVEATRRLVREIAPREVYNLAAISSVAQSWDEPDRTAHVNGLAAVALMESARLVDGVRLVQASSAEIFGEREHLAPGRGDPHRAGQPVRRREGLRPPVRPRLPPARPARVERDPLQPRVAAPAPALRDPQDHLDGRRHRPRRGRRAGPRQRRRPPRLGVGPRLRRRDGARRPRGRAGRLRRRDRHRPLGAGLRGRRLRGRRHRRLGAPRAAGRGVLPAGRPDRAGRRREPRTRGAGLGAHDGLRRDRAAHGRADRPATSARWTERRSR